MDNSTLSSTRANGQRVVIRGVAQEDQRLLQEQATAAGFEISQSVKHADVLVLGDDASDWLRKTAAKSGRSIMTLEAFRTAIELSTAVKSDSVDNTPVEHLPVQQPISVEDHQVRVLDVVLKRNGSSTGHTPRAAHFAHFCLDKPTLQTARTVALAIRHSLPCLLEGETATSKTSIILWLAHLTNAEVVRINLNGQTDTSELVGRYVPSEAMASLEINELFEKREQLTGKARQIVNHIREQDRKPTDLELRRIAAAEQLVVPQWRFQPGLIPEAMQRGYWVILDELNLAEPQVLERLNPVLERPPSLVLTEGPGTHYGPGGDVVVHPNFRMFATMNPAEYAGRTALSPAYRDRWQISRFVQPPSEADLHAMLRRLDYGEHPQVAIDGKLFQATSQEAVYPELVELPEIDQLLERMAIFHSSVCAAAGVDGGSATVGRTRRERYVFSRRTLLTALELIGKLRLCGADGSELNADQAPGRIVADVLERLYVDRVQDRPDRDALISAGRAAGLME